MKILENKLIKAGCSDMFIEEALEFKASFNNDIEEFITYVELKLSSSDTNNCIECTSHENHGIRQTEFDYNGDSFTMDGYEMNTDNKRY